MPVATERRIRHNIVQTEGKFGVVEVTTTSFQGTPLQRIDFRRMPGQFGNTKDAMLAAVEQVNIEHNGKEN